MAGGIEQLSQAECEAIQDLSEVQALLSPITSEGEDWQTTNNCWHQLVFGSNIWIELEEVGDEDVKKLVKIYEPLPFLNQPAYVECQSEEGAHPSFYC